MMSSSGSRGCMLILPYYGPNHLAADYDEHADIIAEVARPPSGQTGRCIINALQDTGIKLHEQWEQSRSREGNCHIWKNKSSKTVKEVKWKSPKQQKLKLREEKRNPVKSKETGFIFSFKAR